MSNKEWKVERVGPEARAELLDLWTTVFSEPSILFEPTYDSYEIDDRISLIIRDGDKLVAGVQVFLAQTGWFDGSPVGMGAIGNVSTLPSHRSLGLSSLLLKESIVRMREAGCKWSYLFTGVPNHYARFGWKTLQQNDVKFHVPPATFATELKERGHWMHPIYEASSKFPMWQVRTHRAWETRVGPDKPWHERLIVGADGSDYAVFTLSETELSVWEWCIVPGHESEAAARLMRAAQSLGKSQLKLSAGCLQAAAGALEALLPEFETLRVDRGMALPLEEGLTHDDLQRLFDSPRAHFSGLDFF